MPKIAAILLDKGPAKTLDYLIPTALLSKVFPGSSVQVPIQSRSSWGIVLHIKEESRKSRLSAP